MTRRHASRSVAILTIALASMFQAAEAAAQAPTDRRTSIGASLFFEAPSFGHLDTIHDQGGPRGLSPGVSIHIGRALSSRVSIGVEIDLATAHTWRGTDPMFVNGTVPVDLPRVQLFRFDTVSPVLMYQIGSTRRWEFAVDGGLAFAHIKSGDVKATYPLVGNDLEPTATDVTYTVGLTAGLSAQLRVTPRLTFVAGVRATSVSFSGFHGFVMRPGGGIRLRF